jgi:hypothetical protein
MNHSDIGAWAPALTWTVFLVLVIYVVWKREKGDPSDD